jgi:CRP/FNR family transcriptional regulator, cyclic AMP receptor protein
MIIPRPLRSRRTSTIEGISLFSGCRPREFQKLETIGTCVQVGSGRTLMAAGEYASEVLLVLSGTASCHVGTREVATFGTGDFFGEIATLCGGPRTATVIARSDMDLWVLNKGEFDEVLQVSPDIARRVLCAMAQRLRTSDLAA